MGEQDRHSIPYRDTTQTVFAQCLCSQQGVPKPCSPCVVRQLTAMTLQPGCHHKWLYHQLLTVFTGLPFQIQPSYSKKLSAHTENPAFKKAQELKHIPQNKKATLSEEVQATATCSSVLASSSTCSQQPNAFRCPTHSTFPQPSSFPGERSVSAELEKQG